MIDEENFCSLRRQIEAEGNAREIARLYPYTAERRDVLGNTSPEAREISRGRGFCTPRPERLPEGHLTRMSLGLFQDLAISFNVWYGTCLTNSSLYCIQCSVLGYSHIWYIDANLFKTVAEYVAGPVIMMSPGLCQGLAIYSITADATINTGNFGNVFIFHDLGC